MTRNPVINWVGPISRPELPISKSRIKKRIRQPTLSPNHTLAHALILNKYVNDNIRLFKMDSKWFQLMTHKVWNTNDVMESCGHF